MTRRSLPKLLADAVAEGIGKRAAPLLHALAEPADVDRFHRLFAGAGRTFGREPLRCTPEGAQAIAAAGGPACLDRWAVDHAARVALLLSMSRALGDVAQVALVEDLFYRGETREKQAVLRALPMLCSPARFVELAVDACRTNSKDEFASIASDNAFPAACFPDAAFNQLVLKAIFVEVPVARIVGLPERATPELARMVEGYASERRAASRAVPDDVEYVVRLTRGP